MRLFLIIVLLVQGFICRAQLSPGFDAGEALDMIQISNSFTFIELYNSDAEILPDGYEKTYTSGVFGMDNKFQIYTSDKGYAVINVRGSTDKKISWMENLYSSMIPSEGEIQVKEQQIHYKFAEDTAAHVHAGYALGIAYMQQDLLFHINYLNSQGVYNIMLTGHSQGGALCQLLMSYLYHLPEEKLSQKNNFKVYSFAAPRVGNGAFVADYDQVHTAAEMSHLIINPADAVPSLPLAYRDGPLITQEEIMSLFNKNQSLDIKSMVYNGFLNAFEKGIGNVNTWFSKRIGMQISKDLGSYSIPPYTDDINYGQIGNLIQLTPFEYPVHLKDSTILKDEARLAELEIGEDGRFTDENLYEYGTKFYQHLAYNYYVAILKRYFPERYEALEPKYLKETL